MRENWPCADVFDVDLYGPRLELVEQTAALGHCVTDVQWALPVEQTTAECAVATQGVLIEHVGVVL